MISHTQASDPSSVAGKPPAAGGLVPRLDKRLIGTRVDAAAVHCAPEASEPFNSVTDWPAPQQQRISPLFHYVLTRQLHADLLSQLAPGGLPSSALHGSHDLRIYREPSGTLLPSGRILGWSARPQGTIIELRMALLDGNGHLVSEQLETVLVPGHRSPEPGLVSPATQQRSPTAASVRTIIPRGLARRYAEVSGDDNPIHASDAAARAVGLPGAILHGTATLALVGSALARALALGPRGARVAQLSARFRRPVPLASELITSYSATCNDARTYRFETRCGSDTVLDHGRLGLG